MEENDEVGDERASRYQDGDYGREDGRGRGEKKVPEKKRSDSAAIVKGILGVLAVIAIGVGILWGINHFKRGNDGKQIAQQSTQQVQQGEVHQQPQQETSSGGTQQRKQEPPTPVKKPNDSVDSSAQAGKQSNDGDLDGFTLVQSLPEVVESNSTNGIVSSRKIYQNGAQNYYVLNLTVNIDGNEMTAKFFTTSKVYNSIESGSVVGVQYNKYKDGSVGIVELSRK